MLGVWGYNRAIILHLAYPPFHMGGGFFCLRYALLVTNSKYDHSYPLLELAFATPARYSIR
jgi:hypothetical protein